MRTTFNSNKLLD